jgi:predicted DNA-binding transcriptional regulator YafY
VGRPGHTITFTSWELEALLRCLEALDGHELKATAQTLHTKVVESVSPGNVRATSTEAATIHEQNVEQSRQKKVVRDRTDKAKKSGMNVVPKG